MKIFNSYGVAVCAALLMLAGCAGSGVSTPGAATGFLGTQGGAEAAAARHGGYVFLVKPREHRDHHKSWRSPKLKANVGGKLLFVSDFGNDDVYVYGLPKMTLEATLTGFGNWPQGMCNDNLGHVWITVAHANAIYEYDNTATLVNTISDPYGWPASCSWDKKTGNLAVTHVSNNGGTGELLIYPNAGGTPTVYFDPAIQYYYAPAYDNRGNLVVLGQYCVYYYSPCTVQMASLARGASSLTTLTVSGTFYSPGGLQWDNSTAQWLAGDQECSNSFTPETSCIRTVSVSGTTATVTGTISLNSSAHTPACDVSQTLQMGDKIYAGDNEYAPFFYDSQLYEDCPGEYSYAPSGEYRWLLPGAGNPAKAASNTEVAPSGVALSNP